MYQVESGKEFLSTLEQNHLLFLVVLSYVYTTHKEDVKQRKISVPNISYYSLLEIKVNQVEKLESFPRHSVQGFNLASAPFIVERQRTHQGQSNNWKNPLPEATIRTAIQNRENVRSESEIKLSQANATILLLQSIVKKAIDTTNNPIHGPQFADFTNSYNNLLVHN